MREIAVAAAAGADITLQAALVACLGLTAAGLLVGAFTGGARGLIGLAVPLLLALGPVSALDVPFKGGIGERRHEPIAVDEIRDAYHLGVGELVLDLRGLDGDEIAGRLPVDVSLVMGELTVLVPDDVTVEVEARAAGGEVDLFGRLTSGTALDVELRRTAELADGVLVVDARIGLGTVTVR